MKKLFPAFLLLFLLALPMRAQSNWEVRPNEISTSFGLSLIDIAVGQIDRLNLSYVDPNSGAYTGIRSGGSRGALNIGYTRQLNSHISVGGALGYNSASIHGIVYNADFSLATLNIYSFMGTAKFDWFHTDNEVITMYSKVGLGLMVTQGIILQGLLKGALVLPTFQTSFVCLEAGKDVLFGFLELGVGMQGIVQAGIRTRF